MTAKIFGLPKPADQWQFTVDVFRRPDGTMAARLADARASLIESGETASHVKLHEIADMLHQSLQAMRADAESLKP